MDEITLIKRCQNGDKDAFEKLLQGHYDTMYRLMRKTSPNKPV